MEEKKQIRRGFFTGERALFHSDNLLIEESVFDDGESPLKESSDIILRDCLFRWKYPLWYCNRIKTERCTWFDMARAGVWYSNQIEVSDAVIEAPKNFRRCKELALRKVFFSNAAETLWHCDRVTMEDVTAKGDYFAMNSSNMVIWGLSLDGNYSFDGGSNIEIHNSRLISKDAFWNSENITVYDSLIIGEYLGWNAKNLTLINCTIESLQGLCYIDNLTMKNCKLIHTTLAFEYSSVEAQIDGSIDSVMNPKSGTISAEAIGTLIMEKDKVDPSKTRILCEK